VGLELPNANLLSALHGIKVLHHLYKGVF